ncbi:hypothetical protein BC829DRAFT_268677 [Chytridium lagenaria]|nr:hypothetical protein BC829DRAFT_268677 [Chytridium lagenaria]
MRQPLQLGAMMAGLLPLALALPLHDRDLQARGEVLSHDASATEEFLYTLSWGTETSTLPPTLATTSAKLTSSVASSVISEITAAPEPTGNPTSLVINGSITTASTSTQFEDAGWVYTFKLDSPTSSAPAVEQTPSLHYPSHQLQVRSHRSNIDGVHRFYYH